MLKLGQPQTNQEELVTIPGGRHIILFWNGYSKITILNLLTLQPGVIGGLEQEGQFYTLLASPADRVCLAL